MSQFIVTVSALNIRQGPGLVYKVIGLLRQNDRVDVVDKSPDGSWSNIRTTGNLVGWSASAYLKSANGSTTPTPTIPPNPLNPQYKVNIYALNVRSGPGLSNSILTTVLKGTVVEYLSFIPTGRWMQVRIPDGRIGWCASQYLDKVNTPPPAFTPTADDLQGTGLQQVMTAILNVYPGPATTLSPVTNLQFMDVVDVQSISMDQNWKLIATALGQTGWCDIKALASLPAFTNQQASEEFPWMPVAYGELRQRAIPGTKNNPRIVEYLNSTTLANTLTMTDEIEWCAAFVNWCIKRAGLSTPNAATVYPWITWGQAMQPPRHGSVVTFQWADGGAHVAFYLGVQGDRVYALGGNQSEAVWIKSYLTEFITAFRIPTGWPAPK